MNKGIKYLLLALIISGCGHGRQEQVIQPDYRDKVGTKRYFFIGWNIQDKNAWCNGNISLRSDSFFSYKRLCEIAWEAYDKRYPSLTKDEMVVTSVFEFKDSIDFYNFQK